MLLDNLGDSEVQIPSDGSSELLHRLIHAGSEYMLSDPTKLEPPQICADQWSSEEEINQEKERLEKANAASDLLNNEFGGHVEENLAAHASFTLSLLERLCNALSDSVSIQMTDQDLNRIAEDKKFHAEKLLLSDRITKLNGEIIQLNSKIIVLENQKSRISRKLAQTHQQLLEARELVAKSQTASNSSNNGDSTTVGQPPLSSPSAPNGSNSDVEKELKRQIAMLERQLTESESAKSKVEMTLTERLARPLSQTEAQVADMRKAMEDLRQQCKQRVSTLVTEVIHQCNFNY